MHAILALSLFSLTIGLETGVGLPVSGFDNQHSSTQSLYFYLARSFGDLNFEMAAGAENFTGKNEDYLLEDYPFLMGLSYKLSLVRFIGRVGPARITRSIHASTEKGYCLTYDLGVGWPVVVERVCITPMLSFKGLSDFEDNGGSLYLNLRVGYEL